MNPPTPIDFWSNSLPVAEGHRKEGAVMLLLKKAVEEGFDLNTPNVKGNTILHVACTNGWKPVIDYCLEKGSVSLTLGEWGKTALECWVSVYEERGYDEGRYIGQHHIKRDMQVLNQLMQTNTDEEWKAHFKEDQRFIEEFIYYVLPYHWKGKEKTLDDSAIQVLERVLDVGSVSLIQEWILALEEDHAPVSHWLQVKEDVYRRSKHGHQLDKVLLPSVPRLSNQKLGSGRF